MDALPTLIVEKKPEHMMFEDPTYIKLKILYNYAFCHILFFVNYQIIMEWVIKENRIVVIAVIALHKVDLESYIILSTDTKPLRLSKSRKNQGDYVLLKIQRLLRDRIRLDPLRKQKLLLPKITILARTLSLITK